MSGLFDGADIIHSYTRAQAIEDGTLVDVSEAAREAGITFPVAVTRAVWEDCVAWADDERASQDESGRLWDVVWMLRFGVQRAAPGADVIRYELLRVPRGGDHAVKVSLKAVCGPGDQGRTRHHHHAAAGGLTVFRLRISTTNAAFQDGDAGEEVARILRDAASRIAGGEREGALLDLNGNTVGSFKVTGVPQ